MNVATHILVGMAIFGGQGSVTRMAAAGLGGMLPDVPSIGMVLWALWIDGYSPIEIYRGLYFSEAWQTVLAPWHSFFLWAGVLAVGLLGRSSLIQSLAASALLHLLCDFPLHGDDAHRQFWPLSEWRFRSPISYWHPAHYGQVLQPIEFALVMGLAIWLFRRSASRRMLVVLAALWLANVVQIASYVIIS
jgi:membrane-bound metal-dependent hydrolase YbcI (DUF457 family)